MPLYAPKVPFSWERGCRGAPGLHGGSFSEESGFERLHEWNLLRVSVCVMKVKVPDGLHLVHEVADRSSVQSRIPQDKLDKLHKSKHRRCCSLLYNIPV